MNDFLAFLNSADVETLTKTPGISRPLAGSIIAARPFNEVEECLKVRGMGKSLLARLQSTFEAGENASEGRAMIPVREETAAPVPFNEDVPGVESPVEKGPSFWSRLREGLLRFARALLRLILLIIIGGGIGAVLYFGVPYLRDKFIVPVEQNSAQINNLAAEIDSLREQNAALQAQLDEMSGRVAVVEKSIEAHGASLEQLAEMQATLESNMQAADEKLSTDLQAGDAQIMLELKQEILLTRSMEFLARARLYLAQSNFGLAKADVQSARALLTELQSLDPDYKPDALVQVIARLDLALANLPAFPVVAASDVDIAAQLLMEGLPDVAPLPTATSLPESTPTVLLTVTPESTPTTTPTP